MVSVRKPAISIIVFNKDNKDCKELIMSLFELPRLLVARCEFVLVKYDNNPNKVAIQLLAKIRRIMPVKLLDYVNGKEVDYYSRAKGVILKDPTSKVSKEEVESMILRIQKQEK